MNAKRVKFWKNWLLDINYFILIIGLVIAFSGDTKLFEFYNERIEWSFFGGKPLSEETLQLKKWLFGIIGGTIVGYHTLMIYLIKNAFATRQRWVWEGITISLLSWFIIDSTLSIYFGAYFNVIVINLFALITIGIPLLITKKAFTN